MNSQELRKQIHNLVDQIEDSKLENILNDLKEELEIIGYRPNGKVVTLGEINRASEEILKKSNKINTYSIAEARKKLGLE